MKSTVDGPLPADCHNLGYHPNPQQKNSPEPEHRVECARSPVSWHDQMRCVEYPEGPTRLTDGRLSMGRDQPFPAGLRFHDLPSTSLFVVGREFPVEIALPVTTN
jgi:hypothetical protein